MRADNVFFLQAKSTLNEEVLMRTRKHLFIYFDQDTPERRQIINNALQKKREDFLKKNSKAMNNSDCTSGELITQAILRHLEENQKELKKKSCLTKVVNEPEKSERTKSLPYIFNVPEQKKMTRARSASFSEGSSVSRSPRFFRDIRVKLDKSYQKIVLKFKKKPK